MPDQRPRPGQTGYVAPPSEFDPQPNRKTPLQEHNAYALEHKDDGWHSPASSDDPPPRHSG